MNKMLAAGIVTLGMVLTGCSDNTESAGMQATAKRGEVKTLHATRKVYAKNIIPRAANFGDNWLEVDKQIVSKSRVERAGTGSTADSISTLLQADTGRIVTESPIVKTIARSVYSQYEVEEPVALSVTWIMSGRPIKGFNENDLYTLDRIYGFSDWKLEEKGIAMAVPTGDIYPGFKNSMFAVHDPVAVYLAVDGGLVEVRASGELAPADFARAIEVVKAGLLRNIRPDNAESHQPENIKVFWNVLQKCML